MVTEDPILPADESDCPALPVDMEAALQLLSQSQQAAEDPKAVEELNRVAAKVRRMLEGQAG